MFFGATALFRPLHLTPNPARYAGQLARLLPGFRFTILGYAGSNFDEIVADMALAIPSPPDLLLGISFGGLVAIRFAARHPELTRRLVLLVSAQRFSSAGWLRMQTQFDALERGDLEALVRENALLFRRPWFNWLVRLKLRRDAKTLTAAFRPPAAILHDYRQLFGPDLQSTPASAARIQCPTLLLAGAADQFFDPAACQETAATIPGAQLRLFEGETHMLPIERSAEVARAIAIFSSPA